MGADKIMQLTFSLKIWVCIRSCIHHEFPLIKSFSNHIPQKKRVLPKINDTTPGPNTNNTKQVLNLIKLGLERKQFSQNILLFGTGQIPLKQNPTACLESFVAGRFDV